MEKVGEMKNVGITRGRKKQRTNLKKSTTIAEQTCVEGDGGDICLNVHTQEILSYLPASKLQTLKRVCKYWLHLITSPYFIKLHLSRANQTRILMPFPSKIIEFNYNEAGTKQIPYPPHISGLKTMFLGSADGLICMVDDNCNNESKYTLFNPSTGKYLNVELSRNFYHILCFWFGIHPSSGEYVLVMGTFSMGRLCNFGAYKFTHSKLICIHYISIDMQIPYPCCFVSPGRGTLVHEAMHWAVRLCVNREVRHTIMAYHPNKNKFWEMSPPKQCEFSLGVMGDDCLFAIHKNKSGVFEVWIMKECWTKYVNIEGFSNSKRLYPLGFLPNGDIILDVDHSELTKYSFEDNKDTRLMQYSCVTDGAIMCVDSLVSVI